MFLARSTLWYGTLTFVVNSLGAHYLMGVPFRARGLLATALLWYPYGFLVGLMIWYTCERKYRENLNAK